MGEVKHSIICTVITLTERVRVILGCEMCLHVSRSTNELGPAQLLVLNHPLHDWKATGWMAKIG